VYRPGISSWQCNKEIFTIGEDKASQAESLGRLPTITSTMYSNNTTSSLGLERCMRIFPQDQDTGGFFIAIIKKIKSLEGFIGKNVNLLKYKHMNDYLNDIYDTFL
jgi:multisite-specific tRNA:(cytosine-C5)-methyltransferase